MNDEDKYLERLGISDDKDEVNPRGNWFNHLDLSEPVLYGLNVIENLDGGQVGVYIETQCGYNEFINHLHMLDNSGVLHLSDVTMEEPIQSIDITGHQMYMPFRNRREITIYYANGDKAIFAIDHYSEDNVRMLLVSWERSLPTYDTRTMRISG